MCVAMAALLLATGVGVFLTMRHLLHSRFDETLTAKARALITASEIDGKQFEIDLIVHEFAGFGEGGDDYFEIRRLAGGVFQSSPSLAAGRADPPGIGHVPVPADDVPRLFNGKLGDGRLARFYVSRFYPKGDKRGRHQDLYLVVASPTGALLRDLAMLGTVLGVAAGAALLLMVPVIRRNLNLGLRAVDGLSSDVSRLEPERLHERLDPAPLPMELKPVALRINDWLARLEASFERERRFSSHAAHELRTPLAELRSMAELAARWPEEATREHFEAMVAVTGELGALIEKLSMLGRADAGGIIVVGETMRLAESLTQPLARAGDKAAKRDIRIERRVEDALVETDPVLWQAIVQNLLDNAVSHSPSGSIVQVESGVGLFAVTNPAPGLETEDLDHLFEQFWRKDPARGGYGHSGLGLSIVRACVGLLGWTYAVNLSSDHRLRIEIRWPFEAVSTTDGPERRKSPSLTNRSGDPQGGNSSSS